jgi:hypothetical protein
LDPATLLTSMVEPGSAIIPGGKEDAQQASFGRLGAQSADRCDCDGRAVAADNTYLVVDVAYT